MSSPALHLSLISCKAGERHMEIQWKKKSLIDNQTNSLNPWYQWEQLLYLRSFFLSGWYANTHGVNMLLWNSPLEWFPLTMYFLNANYEGNGTPLQYSFLESPMDGGAWWASVHGVARSQTRLSDFTFTFHFPALEKEMATHSSVLAWRIPETGEPGGCCLWGHTESDTTEVT